MYNKIKQAAYSTIAAAVLAGSTGCVSHNHTSRDLNTIHPSHIESIKQQTQQPPAIPHGGYKLRSNQLDAHRTANILDNYQFVQPLDVIVYSGKGTTGAEMLNPSRLNLTGVRNPFADDLEDLEKVLGKYEPAHTLVLGGQDTPWGRYQMTTDSGLLAVKNYSSSTDNAAFDITMRRAINVKDKYVVRVNFGTEQYGSHMKTRDDQKMIEAGTDAAVGALAAMHPGGAVFAAHHLPEHIIMRVASKRLPKDTFLTSGNTYISSAPAAVARTTSALNLAARVNAPEMSVIEYEVPAGRGVGVVYTAGAQKLERRGSEVSFQISESEAAWIWQHLLHLSKAGVAAFVYCDDGKSAPAYGGGRTGEGSGGKNPGSGSGGGSNPGVGGK